MRFLEWQNPATPRLTSLDHYVTEGSEQTHSHTHTHTQGGSDSVMAVHSLEDSPAQMLRISCPFWMDWSVSRMHSLSCSMADAASRRASTLTEGQRQQHMGGGSSTPTQITAATKWRGLRTPNPRHWCGKRTKLPKLIINHNRASCSHHLFPSSR